MLPRKLMADFAEVCGIHAGDGWMSSYTNEIGYGTSPKEEQYFQDVFQIYKKIFAFNKMRILKRKAIELRFNSKDGQNLLTRAGFPIGPKLDKLRVPSFVMKNKEWMKCFLRGVVDTDGHVYWRKSTNKYYLVICWTTTAPAFATEIIQILKNLNYHPHMSSVAGTKCDGRKRRRLHRILLIRRADIKKFLEEVGFRNNRRWGQVTKRFQDLDNYCIKESTTTFLRRLSVSQPKGPVV